MSDAAGEIVDALTFSHTLKAIGPNLSNWPNVLRALAAFLVVSGPRNIRILRASGFA